MLITLPCTFALAYLMHRTVESATITLGHRWAAALSRHKRPVAPATV
jgi:peptidoglycan/LPS O-acetylase OafA/YrhL